MSDKPILFSGPMVRAILGGTKTQTRRVVKPQPNDDGLARYWEVNPPPCPGPHDDGGWINSDEERVLCLYGVPGDRLWVRERHCFLDVTKSALSQFPLGPENGNERGPDVWNLEIEYSDGTQHDTSVEGEKPKQTRQRGEVGWRPPIHMPRWASRITLEVTEVRVQRLQEISAEDAVAEGLRVYRKPEHDYPFYAIDEKPGFTDPRFAYQCLWDSINGKPRPVKGDDGEVSHYVSYPWSGEPETRTHRGKPWLIVPNPWVWAVSFKRCHDLSPRSVSRKRDAQMTRL